MTDRELTGLTEDGVENLLQKVILASHNAGKVNELAESLAAAGWQVVGMAEYGLAAPAETGMTFEDNAALKARAAHEATGLWALADDSGLEVDALDGAPGVATADFGGWEKLLEVMTDLPARRRGAQFVCVLALYRNGFATAYFKGICRGEISLTARGTAGFGYDPVFIPAGEIRTFAEMSQAEKNAISHRGIALQKLLDWAQAKAPQGA